MTAEVTEADREEARELIQILAAYEPLESLVAVAEPGEVSGMTRELVADEDALEVAAQALATARASGKAEGRVEALEEFREWVTDDDTHGDVAAGAIFMSAILEEIDARIRAAKGAK